MKYVDSMLGSFLAALFVLGAVETAEAQGAYNYTGSAIATDPGFSCVGARQADENRLFRLDYAGVLNRASPAATAQVVCPLRRRNVWPYGKSGSIDSVELKTITIHVDSSNADAVRCRVFAYSVGLQQEFETADKWACGTTGGCSVKPTTFSSGVKAITFSSPTMLQLRNLTTVNLGYRCWLPPSTSVIGAQAEFISN